MVIVITIGDQRGTAFCYRDYFINRSAWDGNAPDVDKSCGNEGAKRACVSGRCGI